MPHPVTADNLALQRQCACGGKAGPSGECAECRRKRLTGRQGLPEPALQDVVQVEPARQDSGRPLPRQLRAYFEQRFGHDFSQVRIHTGAAAAETARALNAQAFNLGGDIFFGTGRYDPATPAGRSLVAHELVHTMQQEGGRARVQRKKDDETCPRREKDESTNSTTSPYELKELSPGTEWLFYNYSVGERAIEPAKGDAKRVAEPIKNTIIKSSMELFGGRIPFVTLPIKDKMLNVQGFTDCQGSDKRNTAIRMGRAENFCAAVRTGNEADFTADFFRHQIKSCAGAPLDKSVASNSTVEGRRQNRSVRVKVIPKSPRTTPSPKRKTQSLPYDENYGPTHGNCLAYLGTKDLFNKAYANNAYCACTRTPDEPHNNCVRKCLATKRDKFVLNSYKHLLNKNILWCPSIWIHHRDCYKECGCDNSFISLEGFMPMCMESFSCSFVGLSIATLNACMDN